MRCVAAVKAVAVVFGHGPAGIGARSSEHLSNHLWRKPASAEKAHLAHALGNVLRRCGVLFAPDGSSPLQLSGLEGLPRIGVQRQPVVPQFLLNAQVAITRLTHVHSALNKAAGGQVAPYGEPLKQVVDLAVHVDRRNRLSYCRGRSRNSSHGIATRIGIGIGIDIGTTTITITTAPST